MTDVELKKLNRTELLEMLLELEQENEDLRAKNAALTQKLQEREIHLAEAGSIAEAALRLNGVFEAAQAAAEQYLENLKRLSGAGEAEENPDGAKAENGGAET